MLDIYVQERLKLLIDSLGISQKEFAVMIDSTDSAVSRYLSGERIPTTLTLINIAEATGVSPSWILGYGDSKEIQKIGG